MSTFRIYMLVWGVPFPRVFGLREKSDWVVVFEQYVRAPEFDPFWLKTNRDKFGGL